MTGQQLRQQVAGIINGWLGAVQGSSVHRRILDIYNGRTSGYKMTASDAWCAATVSAAWISAGISDWTGIECSCSRFIALAKSKGIWVEADTYRPQVGDAVIYAWSDGSGYAAYDNQDAPDHIGLVTAVNGSYFVVTEGNLSRKVAKRTVAVNGRYIRGFICPDYDKIAASLGGGAASEEIALEVRTYRNGSTSEPVYSDTALTDRVGSLNPWETCPCLGVRKGRYIVLYTVDGESRERIGFAEYDGGLA